MRRGRSICFVTALLTVILLLGYADANGKRSETGEKHPVRFAVIGDRTGGNQPGIYEQIVEEIQRMKPDFLLSVGDMIEGYTGDSVAIKGEWEVYKGLLERFTMPVYLVPGNHDIWDPVSLELYERYIGAPYYSVDISGMHFIFLDNSRFDTVGGFVGEQLEWLVDDLEKNADARYTFVTFHKPFWIETVAGGEKDTLHNVFVKYGVDAVFTGHYHQYFGGEFDGVLYTSVGSSGGVCSPGPTGVQYHFVWVTVDQGGISLAPIEMDAVLPWDEVTAGEYRFLREVEYNAVHLEKVPVADDATISEVKMTAEINNLNDDLTLRDTIHWEVPPGWSIVPGQLAVEIEPQGTYTADFTVMSDEGLYPTPTLSMQYPYAEGKETEIETALQVSRTAYAYRVEEPPVVDGRLDEPVWQNPITKFFGPDGSPMPTDEVSFYFGWDTENLYLAAECIERVVDSMVAHVEEHDGAVWGEDCIGYFLQPDAADGSVYQIYFNALGTAFDQKITIEDEVAIAAEREWDGVYEVKTVKEADRWSIEARIPLNELETEGEAGKTWALNFRRKQRRLNTAADWQVPISYNPRDYGTLLMK